MWNSTTRQILDTFLANSQRSGADGFLVVDVGVDEEEVKFKSNEPTCHLSL